MLNELFLGVCILTTMAFLASLTFQRDGGDDRWWGFLRYLIALATTLLLQQHAAFTPPGLGIELSLVPVALVALYAGLPAGLGLALPLAAYDYWRSGPLLWPALLALGLTLLVCALLRRSDTAYFQHFRQFWWYPLVVFGVADLTVLWPPAFDLRFGLSMLAGAYLPLLLAQSVAFVLGLWVLRTHFRSLDRPEEFQDLAFSDALTGLFNRRQFDEDLAELPLGNTAFLMLLDLDHFKRVNDTRGHAFGDMVLRNTARLLQENVRVNDRVYRYGGEEFAVVLHRCEPGQARRVAERVRTAIERQLARSVGERELCLTISGGLIELQAEMVKAQILEAESLLFAAKEAGRNRILAADGVPSAS